ncbi:hypothetical protein [Luteolibacter sp. AS25]|uniref:hypothetical protein n=1 Tax=Luteolibacter sp. AS25 TaxID=3135776 RepID=UPI00398B75A5
MLNSPGVGTNTPWQIYWSFLSSSLITGSITGYVLGQITTEKQNKAEMATPMKQSD